MAEQLSNFRGTPKIGKYSDSTPANFPFLRGPSTYNPVIRSPVIERGTRGGGGPIAEANTNVPVVSETPGMRSNYSVPITKKIRMFKEMDPTQKNMLVFMKYKLVVDNKPHSALNLPAMNAFLAKNEYRVQNEWGPSSPLGIENAITPDNWQDKFFFFGVIANEVGDMTPLIKKQRQASDRMVNCIIRGHTLAWNVWGMCVRSGTNLFFIVKRMPVGVTTSYKTNPDYDSADPYVQNKKGAPALMPMQFVPYAHYLHERPPLEELKYVENGVTRYAPYILVGKAVFTPNFTNYIDQKSSLLWTNIDTILRQPLMEINVDMRYS